MHKSLAVASLLLVHAAPSAVAGEPIYVRPGQCILIGSQQVCGLVVDGASSPCPSTVARLHVCQYGPLVGTDLPNAKGYSHVLMTIHEDGKKTETHIKNFGPLQEHRLACEAEVKKFQVDPKL